MNQELTLKDEYDMMNKALQGIVGDIQFPRDNGIEIFNKLQEGDLVCASDGSVKDNSGAYAFCIMDPKSENSMKRGNKCHGLMEDMISYKVEAYGALAIVIVIKMITTLHLPNEDDACFWCYIDNSEVINHINKDEVKLFADCTAPEFHVFMKYEHN